MRVDNFKLVHFAEGDSPLSLTSRLQALELISIRYYTLQGLKVAEPLKQQHLL